MSPDVLAFGENVGTISAGHVPLCLHTASVFSMDTCPHYQLCNSTLSSGLPRDQPGGAPGQGLGCWEGEGASLTLQFLERGEALGGPGTSLEPMSSG